MIFCGPGLDFHKTFVNRQTFSSAQQNHVAPLPAIAPSVLENTAEPTNCSTTNAAGTADAPPPSEGRSPTAARTPPSPVRRRRRSSTGSRSRNPRPASPAWPPSRPASPPRPTDFGTVPAPRPSPPASPERLGAAGGDQHHRHHHHHRVQVAPRPCAGGLGGISSPAGFVAGSSDTPQRGERRDLPPPPPPAEPDGSRTIDSCLETESEWYDLCQSGHDSFTDLQVRWATSTIAEVCDGIGAPTELLALAAMTLGTAFGDPLLLETWLRHDDLLLVPAACVLDAAYRNPTVFQFNPETVVDTMVSMIVAAKGDDDGDDVSREADAIDSTRARLLELRGMVEAAVHDGSHWAGPFEFVIELIRRSGISPTRKQVRGIRKKTEAFIRSAVLDGALGELTPSQLACSAFFGATGLLIRFDDEGVGGVAGGGGTDEDGGEDNRD